MGHLDMEARTLMMISLPVSRRRSLPAGRLTRSALRDSDVTPATRRVLNGGTSNIQKRARSDGIHSEHDGRDHPGMAR